MSTYGRVFVYNRVPLIYQLRDRYLEGGGQDLHVNWVKNYWENKPERWYFPSYIVYVIRAQGLKFTRSVTDLHDYKTKIYASLYFKLTPKNRKKIFFNPSQVYKFCLLREPLLTCIKHLLLYKPS